jgi:hypothetical protein
MLHTRSGSTSCDSKFSGVIPRVAIRTLVRTSMQGIDLFLEANVLKCNIWSGCIPGYGQWRLQLLGVSTQGQVLGSICKLLILPKTANCNSVEG